MSREAAIFIIESDEDQTIKELIVNNQEGIMASIKFRRHVEELEIEYDAREYFERVFLEYDVYYNLYTQNPWNMEKIFTVKKGQVIVVLLFVNSAGYWEGIQVLPTQSGFSSIKYYTEREELQTPS